MARADLLALIGDTIPAVDLDRLPVGAVERALDCAVQRLSLDRPRGVALDLVSTGGVLPLAGVVSVDRVESPVAVPPCLLDPSLWRVDAADGGMCITFGFPPATGAAIRVYGSAEHVLDGDADTIPLSFRGPVAALASAQLLDALAVALAATVDSAIAADSADHRGLGDRYAARARAARKVYEEALAASGASPGHPRASCMMATLAQPSRLFRRGR